MSDIQYRISTKHPQSHLFEVELFIKKADLSGQKLRLPNWIPGSYMIRDFAKNITQISAHSKQHDVSLQQLDKSTWEITAANAKQVGEVSVSYSVYAWDLSVRTAHLDQTHGFFNGTSVFLEVLGQQDQACDVIISNSANAWCKDWAVATSLAKKQVDDSGFGCYQATDYSDLIDHPVEMGTFTKLSFSACGVPHDIVLTGVYDCDEQRVIDDLTTICEHHIRFFGEPAPVSYYVFLIMIVGDGYGGLEHRSSTSLLISRKDLPQKGQAEVSESYRNFLGLCSHEYFHTWNVKRLTPAVFLQADLAAETYTPLLWAFEGITSYYDDLALLRSGLIEQKSYLELLAQTMTRVLKGQGRLKQSISDSSFNAWTKFYKQDENAQNAIVSYYAKGTLVALCLDLTLRQHSQYTLDDVMKKLWQDYLNGQRGFADDTIQNTIEKLMGKPCTELFEQLLQSTEELPLASLLKTVDVDLLTFAPASQSDKGGQVIEKPAQADFGAFLRQKGDYLHIVRVQEQGAAQMAGLSAGDDIIAVNQLKLSLSQFEQMMKTKQAAETIVIHAFRRDEFMSFNVSLSPAEANIVVLQRAAETADNWPHV